MVVKPGHRTSEIVVTILANVGYLAAALSDNLTPRWAAIASAISVAAYTISRGLAKRPAVAPVVAAPTAPPVAAPPA